MATLTLPSKPKSGGRQSCKFRSTIFNSAYAVALFAIRDKVLCDGMVLRVKMPSDALWCGDGEPASFDDDGVPIIDVAFVDDECVMVAAASPALLDEAINVVLEVVTRIFGLARFEINWKPGKTACLLRCRGRNASRRLDARRVGPGGALVVFVPGVEGAAVNVVTVYKHLGTLVDADGSDFQEAQLRACSAMAAYAPLAVRILGS